MKQEAMKLETFMEKVRVRLQEELGETHEVKLQDVVKNNNVTFHGIIIMKSGCNVSPTIYMDSFFQSYQKGTGIDEIVSSVLKIYREDTVTEQVDMDFYKDYEKVKDRICMRLVNRNYNRKLLAKVPYIPYLDLAICFYYAYQGEKLGDGSILIHHNHAKMWNMDAKALYGLARENTRRLFPEQISSMEEIIGKIRKADGDDGQEESPRCEIVMKVLTNQKQFQGATAILYDGLLEKLSGEMGGDFYILPSSIHEVILLADHEKNTPQSLKETIYEINHTQLETYEILSDSLYYYSVEDHRIQVL